MVRCVALRRAAGGAHLKHAALDFFQTRQDELHAARRACGVAQTKGVHSCLSCLGRVDVVPRKGTPIRHSRKACQWMRSTTPNVMAG